MKAIINGDINFVYVLKKGTIVIDGENLKVTGEGLNESQEFEKRY